MRVEQKIFNVARITVETTTPLSISTGVTIGAFDTLLVRDANGLPALPGTAIAGVLRHHFYDTILDALEGIEGAAEKAENQTRQVFGFADQTDGASSRLSVSWGAIHNENDEPVDDLILGDDRAALFKDSILKHAMLEQPLFRDHVRINHRGVASNQGKFDRTSLPAGYRFTFELSLWGDDESTWKQLLGILDLPHFRLGAGTRRGLGGLEVVQIFASRFDMTSAQDFERFGRLKRSLADHCELDRWDKDSSESGVLSTCVTATLSLEPEDFWRFGGGAESMSTASTDEVPDFVPVSEPVVIWKAGKAEISPRRIVIPASGVKGALSHRIAFHYNRLTNNFAPGDGSFSDDEADRNEGVRELFGFVEGDKSEAGCVVFDDIFLTENESGTPGLMTHNSIDRFTGGVRKGMLFNEELIFGGKFTLKLHVLIRKRFVSNEAKQAFSFALEDLAMGRLALGAGASKGHGYFTGQLAWTDKGDWAGEKLS